MNELSLTHTLIRARVRRASPIEAEEIDVGLGSPHETSPAQVAATQDFAQAVAKNPALLTVYPDLRNGKGHHLVLSRAAGETAAQKANGYNYIEAGDVFRAIDPDHPHPVPKDLTVMATLGARSGIKIYTKALEDAVKIFNNAARLEAGKAYIDLVAPIIVPRPTFDETVDTMKTAGNHPVFVNLLSENNFALTSESLRAAMEKIHVCPGQIPGGLIFISPHSPSGHIPTPEELVETHQAMQSMNAQRLEKMTALMGGQENFNAWRSGKFTPAHRARLEAAFHGPGDFDAWFKATAEDFRSAMAILEPMCGVEDGAYFGTAYAKQRSISMHEMNAQCPGISDRFVTVFSASKTAGNPNAQSGVALVGPALESWYRRTLNADTVGQNGFAFEMAHAAFDPRHRHHSQQSRFARQRNAQMDTGRALLRFLLEGAPMNGAGTGADIIDPITGQRWSGGVPGVEFVEGQGDSGMFRMVRFKKEHWRPYLVRHGFGKLPFDQGMHAFLRGPIRCKLTCPEKMYHHREDEHRVKIWADPKALITVFSRLKNVDEFLYQPAVTVEPGSFHRRDRPHQC